jgi:hypothetical protein
MVTPAQTPAAKQISSPPAAEMTDAATTPTKINDVTLNSLLLEPAPLAFLKTVAPGNNLIFLNNRAAALLCSSDLPEIPPSISTAFIRELRAGQRTLDTSIINDLALRANENAPETEDCRSDIVKYQERLALQLRDIPVLIATISTLATKLAALTPSGPEAENSIFQHKLALNKLFTDLTEIK